MSPADNVPNFDAMSPEEIMAWMETLAKRQGAQEGFTTEANAEVADIDPSSVVIDEPGYVPSEGKMKGQKIPTVIPPARPAASTPPPVEPPLPAQPAAERVEAPPMAAPEPAINLGSMSWLESLAADQGADFPGLDLSSLAAEIAPTEPQPAAANPVDWLQSLAEEAAERSTVEPVKETAEDSDPMNWLESLAKRQGARDDELMTEADLDVPLPETTASDGPGYSDYSFDAPGVPSRQTPAPAPEPEREAETPVMEDPAAWLDSLASAQGFEAGLPRMETPSPVERQMSDDEISAALAQGEYVPHEQMQAWMNRQLEIGAERPEPEELSAYDPDAPAIPAELPDWLLEQVGTNPPVEETPKAAASQPPLIDTIFEPPAVADMPDWLKEEPEASDELDSIFAVPVEEAQPPAPAAPVTPQPELEVDTSDPWVEAFDEEYERGQADINQLPDWYVRNVSDPERIATADLAAPAAEPEGLQEAELAPETELPLGQPETVPDWLQGLVSEAPEAEAVMDVPDWLREDLPEPAAQAVVEPAVASDMPDWLTSLDVEPAEIPDWLKETLGTQTSEQAAIVQPPAPEAPAPVQPATIIPAPVQGYSPAPVPAPAAQIDVPATLSSARAQASANDINASLQSYEMLIRANAELEAVVDDVSKLVERYKKNPAVYRVLGDGLMRQGKLQLALDTYRKALNQL